MRGELETEQTATYWTQVPLTIAALSYPAGLLHRRSLRAASPLFGADSHCFELQLELQLTDSNYPKPSVAPRYIIVWCPPASCGRRNCAEFNLSIGQVDTPISSTGCTCLGQYVTHPQEENKEIGITFLNPPSETRRVRQDICFYDFKSDRDSSNSELSFLSGCLIKAGISHSPYCLPILEDRTYGFMHFPKAFVGCEFIWPVVIHRQHYLIYWK